MIVLSGVVSDYGTIGTALSYDGKQNSLCQRMDELYAMLQKRDTAPKAEKRVVQGTGDRSGWQKPLVDNDLKVAF